MRDDCIWLDETPKRAVVITSIIEINPNGTVVTLIGVLEGGAHRSTAVALPSPGIVADLEF